MKIDLSIVYEADQDGLGGVLLCTGQEDKSIAIWSTLSGQEVARWHSNAAQGQGHLQPPSCLAWAPRRLLVASACYMVNLWIPAVADLKQMGLVN